MRHRPEHVFERLRCLFALSFGPQFLPDVRSLSTAAGDD
jgi:hypothetical protein